MRSDTFDVLYETYGPTMSLASVAQLLAVNPKSLYNRLARGTSPIVFHKVSRRWVAMTVAVAAHVDTLRIRS